MNKVQFYNGLLSELRKTAAIQPKKKSFFNNPALWGGLAAAGLGGYGLYKHFQGKEQPQIPNSAIPPNYSGIAKSTNFNPESVSDAGSRAISSAQAIGPAFGASIGGSMASPLLSSAANKATEAGLSRTAKALSSAGKLTSGAGSWTGRSAIGLGGASQVFDALDPNQEYPTWARNLQAGGGATDAAIQVLGKNNMGNILAKGATRYAAPEVAKAIGARGAGMLIGGPMYAAYGSGVAGQMAIDKGTQAAEQHANNIGPLGADLLALRDNFNSDNQYNRDVAYNGAKWLFASPEGKQYSQDVTQPNDWARIGYNPMPVSLNPWTWSKWYNNKTEVPVIQNQLDKLRDTYYKEVMRRGDTPDAIIGPTPAPQINVNTVPVLNQYD